VIQLQDITIDERTTPQDLERFRRNLVEALREMQRQPAVFARPIKGIVLEDGIATPVPHGLGRKALVFLTPCRGGSTVGSILELTDGVADSSKYFTLQASGWGATITVDALVL